MAYFPMGGSVKTPSRRSHCVARGSMCDSTVTGWRQRSVIRLGRRARYNTQARVFQ